MIAAARAAAPDAQCDAILDCGDAPGLALEALRHGVKALRLTGPDETVTRVADIAGQMGARIETAPRDTMLLDLDGRHDPYDAALRHIGDGA